MGKNVVQAFSQVHDNRIKAYTVDVENRTLSLETVSEDKTAVNINFDGLLAHCFENVISSNIIFNIEQVTVEHYIETNKKDLTNSLRYGFPVVDAPDVGALKQLLKEEMYKIYRISSSLGLSGIIIAKEILIRVQNTN